MFSKRIILTGTGNTRTLSNLINKEGKHIKDNLLIRSDALHSITLDDQRILKEEYNLRQVFDLRNILEAEIKPDVIEDVKIYNLPVLSKETIGVTKKGDDNRDFKDFLNEVKEKEEPRGANKFMQNVYTQVVVAESASYAYRTFLHELLKSDGASLWHCSAGKDRAGFATILVLYLLDFDMETIINDYLGTNHYYTPKVEKMMEYYGIEYTDTLWSVFGVEREYLDVLFNVINEKYGSFDNYLLKELNIDENFKQEFKDKYLEV